jgi:ribosome-binding ATPase
VQFVDIAGLVQGASEGEGLGNQFLANIRETDAIVHVVRCFDDPDVVHVMGSVDPVRDREVINLELALADLAWWRSGWSGCARRPRAATEAKAELALLERLHAALGEGKAARAVEVDDEEAKLLRSFNLLTAKPVLYLANVAESDLPEGDNEHVRALRAAVEASGEQAEVIPISSKIESELAELPDEERDEFLASLGLEEPGLHTLIRTGYRLLGLQTYFTAGEKEVRAWTIPVGAKAPEAAGVIHSDFERGFIRAETVAGTTSSGRQREGRARPGADALGGEGVRGEGRGHPAVPVQRVVDRYHALVTGRQRRRDHGGGPLGTAPARLPIDRQTSGYYVVEHFSAHRPRSSRSSSARSSSTRDLLRYLVVVNEGDLPTTPVPPVEKRARTTTRRRGGLSHGATSQDLSDVRGIRPHVDYKDERRSPASSPSAARSCRGGSAGCARGTSARWAPRSSGALPRPAAVHRWFRRIR